MIVHVLYGVKYHLSPTISQGFCDTYREVDEPIFIIYGRGRFDIDKYLSIYKGLNSEQYHFCTSYLGYLRLLVKYRNNPILFHAGGYKYMMGAFLVRCKSINWVCWGAGTTTSTWKSRLAAPLKRYMYQHFNSIVTLMDDDKASIVKCFSVLPDKIQTISYQPSFPKKTADDVLCWNMMHEIGGERVKPIVMLGNNSHQIPDYIKLLSSLERFKGKVRIWCMMNYSLVKDSNYTRLMQLGKEMYGDDFENREEFYEDRESLLQFMNNCDIYMCVSKTQTGLGAIENCCLLGKKMYITGRNFNWMQNAYGVKVFEAGLIDNGIDFDEFVEPLSMKEKEYNFNCILNRRESQYQHWRRYLSSLRTND